MVLTYKPEDSINTKQIVISTLNFYRPLKYKEVSPHSPSSTTTISQTTICYWLNYQQSNPKTLATQAQVQSLRVLINPQI